MDIDGMDGSSFEQLTVRLLVAMGLEVEQTSKGADAGVDIFARSHEPVTGGLFLVQCKRYSCNVGEPVLRDLYGTVLHAGAAKGILITNAEFTRNAMDFARGKPLELIGGPTLRALLQKHGIDGPLQDGHVVARMGQRWKIIGAGLQDIAALIRRELDRHRLMSEVGRKPCSLPAFFDLAGEVASGMEADFSGFFNVLRDLCGANNGAVSQDPPDKGFIDSRLAMIDEIIRRILRQCRKIRETRIGEEYAALKTAAVAGYESFLDQFATFIENDVSNALKLDGAVLPENPQVELVFSPNMDAEVAALKREVAEAERRYKCAHQPDDSTARSSFGAYLIAGLTIVLLLFAGLFKLLRVVR